MKFIFVFLYYYNLIMSFKNIRVIKECPICFEDKDENLFILIKCCSYNLCKKCYKKINKICPICRVKFIENKKYKKSLYDYCCYIKKIKILPQN